MGCCGSDESRNGNGDRNRAAVAQSNNGNTPSRASPAPATAAVIVREENPLGRNPASPTRAHQEQPQQPQQQSQQQPVSRALDISATTVSSEGDDDTASASKTFWLASGRGGGARSATPEAGASDGTGTSPGRSPVTATAAVAGGAVASPNGGPAPSRMQQHRKSVDHLIAEVQILVAHHEHQEERAHDSRGSTPASFRNE